MRGLADEVKDIIKDVRARIDRDENFIKIVSDTSPKFFDLGRKNASKELTIISFLWSNIGLPLRAITEKIITKRFPKRLEKVLEEGSNHELAISFLGFLNKKNLEDIVYHRLINYERGEVDFNEIKHVFEIEKLELPMEEKGFIILIIAKELSEAWREAYMEISKLVKNDIDELDEKLKSMEGNEEVLSELRKVTEGILYALHLRALGD